ncbi:hypothetical protein VP01_1214g7 [Puccinia sorghi]|uniref:Phosphoglycerate mutase n=1 Tax=Puccinia sorghi TaxID=27349 RepID=A0A0L6VRP7_9BASI|nr:hypothetical protein VP01_1214g7 [Puccinia sorghi]
MVIPKRLPRVYCVRHGPTEWSLNGRHVSVLLGPRPSGKANCLCLGVIGSNVSRRARQTYHSRKVAKKSSLTRPLDWWGQTLFAKVLISPRQRAKRTFELLFKDDLPTFEIEENVREWTYGDYEGLWKHEVVDGCEGGESPEEVTARVDYVVEKVKDVHRAWVEDPERKADDRGGDVLIVTHGHFSRCFVARWLGLPLTHGSLFTVETGSVTIGQYYGGSLDFPILGGLNIGTV